MQAGPRDIFGPPQVIAGSLRRTLARGPAEALGGWELGRENLRGRVGSSPPGVSFPLVHPVGHDPADQRWACEEASCWGALPFPETPAPPSPTPEMLLT